MTHITSHDNSRELARNLFVPTLKVVGVGGGGCNAIHRMIELGMNGVEFIAMNTDHQALIDNPADKKIQLGPELTRGLGAGGNPEIGKQASIESIDEIKAVLDGSDMVFLTAGMGGGTGTGAIPIAAQLARDIGAISMAIVTTPFSFEMGRRQLNATSGLKKLRQHTHTLITIPNDQLLKIAPKHMPMETAFILADDVLRQSVQCITELITKPGLINIDFAHIRRLIMSGGGSLMAIGEGRGQNKVRKAVDQALNHPLLEEVSLYHSAGIIANFSGGQSLTLSEINNSLSELHHQAGPDTEIVFGVNTDEEPEDRVQLILVVTGLGATPIDETMRDIPIDHIQFDPPSNQLSLEPMANYQGATVDYDLPAFLRRRVKTSQ